MITCRMSWLACFLALVVMCAQGVRCGAQEEAPVPETAVGAGAGTSAAGPATPTSGTPEPARAPARELTVGEALLLKLKQGGWTMFFLLLTSIAGVGYAIERFVNLRSSAIAPAGLAQKADELWRAGKLDELRALPQKDKSTMARVLAVIADHPHSSMADVSLMAGDVASRDMRRHLQRAYPLAVVATVAPLLGLFGTVIGMIGAFDKVAAAGSLGDASMLGGDISKALITTAAGLTIAIPALVLYHFFKNRTSLYGLMLEEEVSELINAWFGADRPSGMPEKWQSDTAAEARNVHPAHSRGKRQ